MKSRVLANFSLTYHQASSVKLESVEGAIAMKWAGLGSQLDFPISPSVPFNSSTPAASLPGTHEMTRIRPSSQICCKSAAINRKSWVFTRPNYGATSCIVMAAAHSTCLSCIFLLFLRQGPFLMSSFFAQVSSAPLLVFMRCVVFFMKTSGGHLMLLAFG